MSRPLPPSPARAARRRGFAAARGSVGRPGSDLARLPIALDPRGVHLAEGVRAAFAFGLIILVNEWVQWPPLLSMALAANLTCFCDMGGPIRARMPVLIAFSVLGALIWLAFGLLWPLGPAVLIPASCAVIFTCAYARVWSVQTQAAGNVLVVVLCIALHRPLDAGEAVVAALMFLAGGLWASLLALVLWRLHPYADARRAVAEVWQALARLAGDLEGLAAAERPSAAAFDDHARAHRRGVRAGIETASALILDLVRSRERVSSRAAQTLLRLESAEQVFTGLVALGDLIESRPEPERRAGARAFLRSLRPLLIVVARAIRDDRSLDLPRIEGLLARAGETAGEDAALHALTDRVLVRVGIGAKLSTPEGYRPALRPDGREDWRARVLRPLRVNFTLASANLRHAVRAAIVAAPALAATLVWSGAFTHWLVITVVLTMQPFYATTWQRALERIGGTVLGGLVGAGLASVAVTPLAQAALIVPLSILGFAARQVSYGAFIACLTPMLVLLIDVFEPGHGSWEIAGMRALFTVLGGLIAVVSCLALWPVWEPDEVRRELRRAISAHARMAALLFAGPVPGREAEIAAAGRETGLSLNDLETALSRALQQPRAGRHPEVEAAMVADAALRRISARFSVLRHGGPEGEDPWKTWVRDTLAVLAGDAPLPARPSAPRSPALARLVAQVDLLAGTLRPGQSIAAEAGAGPALRPAAG